MAWYAFTGDPNAIGTDPAEISFGGVAFRLGEAVEVSDETLAAKLVCHSHFTRCDTPFVGYVPAELPAGAFPPAPVESVAPIRRGPGRPRKVP